MKFFIDFKNSFYNFSEYRKMIKKSYGKSFLYAVLLSLILSLVITIKTGIVINDVTREATNFYNSEVPYFEIHDGKLDVDTELPYFIDDGNGVVYIDTREGADQSIESKYDEGLFIFRDKMIQKQFFKTQTIEFSQFGTVDFTKDDVDKIYPMISKFKIAANILVYIGYFIYSILSFLVLSLIYGLVGLIIKAIMKSNLTFTELANASIYALTVPKIIKIILSIAEVDVPHYWIVTLIITVVYLVMVVKQKDDEALLIEKY
ncbi:hypothetical protein SH2C18_50550 [Clostridium sediminicola]|uniref:DUF1189 domain-containing protein n=1 Tax=Clostridium sediminicola TaxID=3114879 RepID=UPI0031F26697